MYYTFFTGCRWHVSSTTAPLGSSDTLVARDLTLTDSSNMRLSMHHFLHAGSLLCILTVSSAIMFLRAESFTSSSQPAMTVVTLHLIKLWVNCKQSNVLPVSHMAKIPCVGYKLWYLQNIAFTLPVEDVVFSLIIKAKH